MSHKNKSSIAPFRLWTLFCLCLSVALSATVSTAATPPTVALQPFTVHAAKDLDYLRSGIQAMLASRLTDNAGVTIVQSPAKADYVLKGSLTSFGGSLSIDAVLVPSGKKGGAQNFYATAAKEEEVIKAVDSLSWDIAAKAFGKKRPAPAAPAQSQVAAIPSPAQQVQAGGAYQTSNPELAFRSRFQQGNGSGSLVQPLGVVTSPLGFTKSQNLLFGLVAMDVGDVDGDGQDEFVLAAKNELRIYRRVANRFQQIAKLSTPIRYGIHSVTLGDLNHNGRDEIYVSAADAKQPNSFVLEWDGKQFSKLADNQRWYIRVINIPGEGLVLAGQKAGFEKLLAPGIFHLTLNGGELTQGPKVNVTGVNLFDFTLVDLDGNGSNEVVAISQGDKLVVLRPSGSVLWVSDEYYGGTTRYLGGKGFDDINKDLEGDSYQPPRIYVPARIIIRDVNNDGQPDVIVSKNLSTASRILSKFRSYPSGEIHALTWNGIALTELWRTRKIDGYIADYQMGPLHKLPVKEKNDKKTSISTADLYVGLVLRSGGINILKNSESTVLTFPLRLSASQDKQD